MHLPLANHHFRSDPLNEYRWIDIASPPLAQLVEAIWIYGGPDVRLTEQVLVPHWKTCVAVVREWKTGDRMPNSVRFLLLGPVTTTQPNFPNPGTEIIAARLHPEAVSQMTNLSLVDLCDQEIQWNPALPYSQLQRIAETSSSPLPVASALVEALVNLHRDNESPHQSTQAAASLIRFYQGRASIKAIAEKLDCSDRSIRRQFKSDLGLSPKRYARFVRLKAMMFDSDLHSSPNWAGLAHKFGYTDQAHMLRDVRDLTGYKLSKLHYMRRTPSVVP